MNGYIANKKTYYLNFYGTLEFSFCFLSICLHTNSVSRCNALHNPTCRTLTSNYRTRSRQVLVEKPHTKTKKKILTFWAAALPLYRYHTYTQPKLLLCSAHAKLTPSPILKNYFFLFLPFRFFFLPLFVLLPVSVAAAAAEATTTAVVSGKTSSSSSTSC